MSAGQNRPTDSVPRRTGITARSDRTSKDDHRDRLAADLARFLDRGGEIEQLPGPGNGVCARVGHGGGLGI